jgi:hypothetical protein
MAFPVNFCPARRGGPTLQFLDAAANLNTQPPNLDAQNRFAGGINPMAAFDEHGAEIEHYEQMLGTWRGRLAVALDRVTEAMLLVGQHGIYCHSARDPEKPAMDIELVTRELRKAKELVQNVMEGLRTERGGPNLPLQ